MTSFSILAIFDRRESSSFGHNRGLVVVGLIVGRGVDNKSGRGGRVGFFSVDSQY